MSSNGRSLVEGEDGVCRILYETASTQILGIHLVGAHSTEFIQEASMGLQLEFTLAELAETIHAHSTVSEAFHEGALLALGRPIHMPKNKKMAGG